jgi:hypothetical protein
MELYPGENIVNLQDMPELLLVLKGSDIPCRRILDLNDYSRAQHLISSSRSPARQPGHLRIELSDLFICGFFRLK